MASELKVDKCTGVSTAGYILVTGEGNSTTTNLQQGLSKVWCAADENSSVVVRDSFNISTLTDNSIANTSFNFANAMGNTGFSGVATSSVEGSAASYDVQTEISDSRTSTGL